MNKEPNVLDIKTVDEGLPLSKLMMVIDAINHAIEPNASVIVVDKVSVAEVLGYYEDDGI